MRVAQHLVVGSEDGAVLVAQLRGDGLAIALDLRRHGIDGLIQPRQFLVHGVVLERPPRDHESLFLDHERFADGDAG